ncbi:hypothetical protein [Rhodopila sp.]|jgi:hypothetical protein|uniref:hypothetical protein n=1 Tax=Rhodopila sp. TaxID=2480087 RepID=UPI002BF995A9|nr:hypothetical protein [Rhodopila sp.]HVZ10776.1 hypothetical protein [Rhodopila sp.]
MPKQGVSFGERLEMMLRGSLPAAYFHPYTSTSTFVAKQAASWSNKLICIVPNFLSREQQILLDRLWELKDEEGWRRDDHTHLSYFSGLELKWFATAIVGALTVASSVHAYRRVIESGRNGWQADPLRWHSTPSDILRNIDELRADVAPAARADAMAGIVRYLSRSRCSTIGERNPKIRGPMAAACRPSP